jgi:hypothetical protein
VPCSDGNTYFFGSTNGKVFKRTSAGTWSVAATIAPAAGAAGVLGACESDGYVYYATQNRLGRWQIGTAWSSRNDNFGTFTNGDLEWHPMKEVNLVLYIGDGDLIAQVDAGVFTADALDLPFPAQTRIKCLGRFATDLLIGTYVNSNVVETQLFRWNTWSVSFSGSDPIPEVGINSFIDADNFTFVNAGTKGNIYLYDGSSLDVYKGVKGDWRSTTNKGTVHPEAKLNFHGLPLFGFSQQSGAPTSFGIYSLGRANRNYPFVLALEYLISTGHSANVEIGAIAGNGDTFLVAWKDTNSGTTYGVDILDLNNKFDGAYFTTRTIISDRRNSLNYKRAYVGYRSLPANTEIVVGKSVNYDSFEDLDGTEDEDRMVVETDVDISDATVVQIRVTTSADGNNAPEIDTLLVGVDA